MRERPVLVAPDSFKGTLRSTQVSAAVGRGLERGGLAPPDLCPVADGGEGTLEVLVTALGGEIVAADAHDPLGRPLRTSFALLEGGETALVEVAAASGLGLGDGRAEEASSRGTGELIRAAAETGARFVIVAAGGSATTDGGAGALEALGGQLAARLVVLCDVRTPWERAAEVFGPQKGADPAAVERLTARLHDLAGRLPRDPRGVPMTGAAGGLAGGLWAVHGATLEAGAQWVLDALGFDARLRAARCVVTGEGRLDQSSLQGKLVFEICTRARQGGIPAHAIVGEDALDAFGKRIVDLQHVLEGTTVEAIEEAGVQLARLLQPGR